MFEIKIKIDAAQWKRDLTLKEFSQVPFATVLGLTKLGQAVKKRQEQEIERIFDRPTRFTRNAIRLWPAVRERLQARVWLRDDMEGGIKPSNYLTPHIDGGGRKQKRSEVALRHAGILPSGWHYVPGGGAKFDAYGNMSPGQIVQILSYLQAGAGENSGKGYVSNISAKRIANLKRGRAGRRYGKEFFVVSPNGSPRTRHLAPGVYEKTSTGFGTAIRPVMIFVPHAKYRKRWRFFEIGDEVIEREFSKVMDAALAQALRTSR